MSGQERIVDLMQREYFGCQKRNPAFSLRGFARRLGLAPSALSEILNGKRQITRKMGQKILTRLSHDPSETEHIVAGLKGRYSKTKSGEPVHARGFSQLPADQYRILSDWYCFALLSLAETRGFRAEPRWISKRLQIRASEAKSALARLIRLGLLKTHASGALVPTGAQLSTTSDVRDLSLQKSHRQNLDLARRSLDEDGVEVRDITAITMAIDPAKMEQAKDKIRKFRREMSEFLETGEKKEVYKLCIQLFPVSKPISKKEDTHV